MVKKRCVFQAAALCLLFSACGPAQNGQTGGDSFKVLETARQDITLTDNYPASIRGRQDIAIYPQVSGTISKVCVKEGQRVRKGQSLFVIDQVPYKAALQMAQANVKAAEAAVATSQLVYDSRKALYGENVISEYDLRTSENSLLSAKAQLAQAQAQEVTAQNNMTYTMVLSPADGVVGTLPFREGALVSPSTPTALTTVSDNSSMYVYFSITENELLALCSEHGSMDEVLKSLPEVELMLNDGSIYAQKGFVETISGVIDSSTGSVSVRAVFPNEGGILHSGASGRIVLPYEYAGAIVIPASSTFELQDRVFVFLVRDGKAVSRQVEVLLTDDGKNYVVKS
ncbi:MAG: efflux RND transporter periplasmic adaptor subunit, partial [Candidatus Cryptobacteroides sp.]